MTAISFFFYLGGGMFKNVCTFLGSGLTPCHDKISEKGNTGTSEKAFVFV